MTAGTKHRRDGYWDHPGRRRQQMRKKRKVDPCLALPVAPDTGVIDWVQRNTRHAPWWADCYWPEVVNDVDGFTLRVPVRRYLVQFQHRDPTTYSVNISRIGSTAYVEQSRHGLSTGDKVTIAGADQAAYNGTFTITRVNNTTYTYTVAGTPTTPATGTITSNEVESGTRRFTVPAHDNDDDSTVHKLVHVHHRDWDYRFRTRAETGVMFRNRSDWSSWSTWTNPNDPPPDPTDVQISRASHAVRLAWDAPNDIADSDIMDRRIAYFIAELYSTTDPDVRDYGTLHKRAKHVHGKHHRFHVNTDASDEVWYYGRVRSVTDDDVKGTRIPATKSGNSDSGATPSIVRALFHRSVHTFSIVGPLEAKTYVIPLRIEDDYIVRRVSLAVHKAGTTNATHVDIKVNGGGTAGSGYVFGDSNTYDVSLASGDRTAQSKQTQDLFDRGACLLEAGDHLRVVVRSVSTTPPENGTVSIVMDRYWAPTDADEEASVGDTGGGGGE